MNKDKSKMGERNMSSIGKLTELIKTNLVYSSFKLNLTYHRAVRKAATAAGNRKSED